MAVEQASFNCPRCKQMRLFSREKTNHILHLLLSFLLCGLWIFIWILVAIDSGNKPFFCQACGYSDLAKYLNNPNLRNLESIDARARRERRQQLLNRIINYEHLNKIAVIFFLCCVIGAAVVLVYRDKATVPTETQNIVSKYQEEDFALTTRLRKDVSENFSKTTWYGNIRNISVSDKKVSIYTDLPNLTGKGETICGAVSGVYFGYSKDFQSHTAIIYGTGAKLLGQREGIGAKCK